MSEQPIETYKLETLDFRVVGESWSRYRLDDKTILLARLVTTKVFLVPESQRREEFKYTTASSFVLSTICPTSMRGPPTLPLPDFTKPENQVGEKLKPIPEAEPWNSFQLADRETIFNRITVSEAVKTKFHGIDGDPIYLINWTVTGFRLTADNRFIPMQTFKASPPSRNESIPEK